MNRHIIELAKQAGYQEDSSGVNPWDTPEFKEFYELLIRDCAIYLNDVMDDDLAADCLLDNYLFYLD